MKRSFGLVLLVVLLGLSLAGCSCYEQKAKGEAPPPAAPEQKTVVAPEQKEEMVVKKEAPAPAPAVAAAAMDDIHFDFDRYNIRPGDAAILRTNYGWLKANAGKVRIEGNCDERGTVEYNLALGQKRADTAKAYLVSLGAEQDRIDTVSYGKEKPLDPGHDEAAWAKNRRDHFTPLQ